MFSEELIGLIENNGKLNSILAQGVKKCLFINLFYDYASTDAVT
jgi:hypothetical protein